MSASPSVAIDAFDSCMHINTVLSMEMEGQYLHRKAFMVVRCEDCLRILDTKVLRSMGGQSFSDKKP